MLAGTILGFGKSPTCLACSFQERRVVAYRLKAKARVLRLPPDDFLLLHAERPQVLAIAPKSLIHRGFQRC
jgi:hypothetical protein